MDAKKNEKPECYGCGEKEKDGAKTLTCDQGFEI